MQETDLKQKNDHINLFSLNSCTTYARRVRIILASRSFWWYLLVGTSACEPDSSRDFSDKESWFFCLSYKDTPKAKPILTLSHCRRRANKSNCPQKTGIEPGTSWIARGLIMEPQKETDKLFRFFLCSQPGDTSSTYPTELLSFFRTNCDSPKKSTE